MQGFLGTRASLYPDIVVSALVLVLPAFFYGAKLAKEGKTKEHARIMSGVFSALFVVVVGFVVWNKVWNDSHPPIEGTALYDSLYKPLAIFHVFIAVGGTLLGLFLVITGIKWRVPLESGELAFDSPSHARFHIIAGWIALVGFLLIAITGLVIYYLRYVYLP